MTPPCLPDGLSENAKVGETTVEKRIPGGYQLKTRHRGSIGWGLVAGLAAGLSIAAIVLALPMRAAQTAQAGCCCAQGVDVETLRALEQAKVDIEQLQKMQRELVLFDGGAKEWFQKTQHRLDALEH